MRRALRFPVLALLLAAPACQETVFVSGGEPFTPQNLTYELEPSGEPNRPLGILLVWDDVSDGDLSNYRIYSRGSTSGAFGLRGETTSNTFHDNGVPHLEYFVTAVNLDGGESNASNTINVAERQALEQPASLFSISLNRAIHLQWADNAFDADRFKWYRIYSTEYDLDAGECDVTWFLEGTTVAPEFLAGVLTNGEPRCFGVTAVSIEGYESLWSPLWQDTPRPDARNTLVFALQDSAAQAGFRFWSDANGDGQGQASELGLVESGNANDVDFRVSRGAGDSLWIEPVYAGTRAIVYGQVADLTSIDLAPDTGYGRSVLQAVPTYGYVFEIVEAVGERPRYGAIRVTHVGREYLIFDWSLQTDPGNPELVVRAGLTTSLSTGTQVTGPK